MSDIYDNILNKHGVDIDKVNILKLYKIDNANISSQELEEKIKITKDKWTKSVNGANEKFAKRDKEHLDNHIKYEGILRNDKLRKELYKYYNGKNSSKPTGESGVKGDISFAKQYFKLINKTKKIKKREVDFFFAYYQEERKNKKAIYQMLESEFKVMNLDKDTEKEYNEETGKKKKESSALIVNLFQEATLLRISKIEGFYKEAVKSDEVKRAYPNIEKSMYEYIGIESKINLNQFKSYISKMRDIVFNQRQEKGQEYAALVDLFNGLYDILDYRDVVDNFNEFKLILKYPKLTPYMYCIDEVKKDTLNDIFQVAKKDYYFKDVNDFISAYFKLVYDNFNVRATSIKGMLQKADKKAKTNKLFNGMNKLFNKNKEREINAKVPIIVDIIYYMVYFPLFIVYFIFEIFKYIFTRLGELSVLNVVIIGLIYSLLCPKIFGINNILDFFNKVNFGSVYAYIENDMGATYKSPILSCILGFGSIVSLVAVYGGPLLIIISFINGSIAEINESFDWIGMERTFENIFVGLKEKTKQQYRARKKSFYKDKLIKISMNIISTIILVILMSFVPDIVNGMQIKFTQWLEANSAETVIETTSNNVETDNSKDVNSTMTNIKIVVDKANIRAGANTIYDVVKVGELGELYLYTGNKKVDEENRVWYEVYINELKTNRGWISERVSVFEDK